MPTKPEKPESGPFLRRRQILQGAIAAVLPASLLSCAGEKKEKSSLIVGGLPVTCNLTLPVACVARTAANVAGRAPDPQFSYEYSKYSGWPEIKESLMSGRLQAAYMLAPLIMGSIIQNAATPIAGYERGYVILGAMLIAGGVIGLLFIRPEADRKRLAARAVPALPLSPARA